MRIMQMCAVLVAACFVGRVLPLVAQQTTPEPQPAAVDVVYGNADRWLQRLDIYLPDDAGAPTPTVLLIHGGGFRVGDKDEMTPIARYFAASGFAVVNINYRLTPNVVFPAPVADSACALGWLHANAEEYGFDTGRVVAVGESAGGYLAAMLGVADRDPLQTWMDDACSHRLPEAPVAAVIPYYPMTGIAIDDYSAFSRPFFDLFLGSAPEDDDYADRYAAASPLTYIDGSEPPFLILNGTRDPLLPRGDADALAAALEAADVPVEVALFDAGEHAFIARLRTTAGQAAAERARAFIAALES